MKYIFTIFLILIFITEHFYPVTKPNSASQDISVVEDNICLSACDFPIKSTEKKIVNDIWAVSYTHLTLPTTPYV